MPSSWPLTLGNASGPVQLAGRLPSSWFSCRPMTCSLKNALGAHCPGRLPLSWFIWSVIYLQQAATPQHATPGAVPVEVNMTAEAALATCWAPYEKGWFTGTTGHQC